MNKFFIAVFLLVLGLSVYFIFSKDKSIVKEHVPLNVTVGWIGTLTGPARMIGVDNLNAVSLALKEYQATRSLNDPNITLISADNQYSDTTTEDEYKQMAGGVHKPVAILIGTYSGMIKIASQAMQDSILLINTLDNDKKLSSINHNIFLIAKETELLAGVVANGIMDHGKKNIAIIYYGEGDFMPRLSKISKEILLANGVHVHLYEYKSEKDFHSFLEKAAEDKADGYVFFGFEEIGFAMKQAREMGISAPFYSVNVITDPVLLQNAGKAINGTYFAQFTSLDGNRVNTDEFLNKYVKSFKGKPFVDWTAMQGYDAANILFAAIKEAGAQKGDFIENLRDALLSTSNFEGVSGNITILPTGASRGIYPRLYRMENGTGVPAQ